MASTEPMDVQSPDTGLDSSPTLGIDKTFVLEYNEEAAKATFFSSLRNVLPESVAREYAASLARQAIPSDNPPQLAASELAELGIRIGHREAVSTVLANFRAADLVQLDDEQTGAVNVLVEADEGDPFARSEMRHDVVCVHGGKWYDWSGTDATYEQFKMTIAEALTVAKLPMAFMRMFTDKKPSPYCMTAPNSGGRLALGLLLRVPRVDLVASVATSDQSSALSIMTTSASTLAEMANRLVVIYQAPTATSGGRLFTFRKDGGLAWMDELKAQLRDTKDSRVSVEAVGSKVIKDSLEAFRDVCTSLRHELEVASALPDGFRPVEVVKTLSRLQRQAAVVRRCITGNERVLRTASSDDAFKIDAGPILVAVEDMKETAEEIEQNASELFNLRLAMIDFRSQMNMRVFTNMTVVVAPLSIITGWFGMNFEDMEELRIPGFYYGVVAFVLALIVVLSLWLVYLNRDRHVSPEAQAEATSVLEKAGEQDDD